MKAYIVTDLGTGDGGKGGVVHAVAGKVGAGTVIKDGGGQGSHGVFTSSGKSFAFSHLGCATLEGVRTHLSSRFILKPNDLLNEAEALRREHQVGGVYDLLTVDERALCATPIHRLASKLEELLLRGESRGTVGSGVGNAVADSWRWPDLAIRAGEMASPDLVGKMEELRQRKLVDFAERVDVAGCFLREDEAEAAELLWKLRAPSYARWCADRFAECARAVRVVPHGYMGETILTGDVSVVVERSHGVLTDRLAGFHPHTSKIRTLPSFAVDMLRDAGFDGEIVSLGICRAYGIRHGAGPFVTRDDSLLEKLLPGSHKVANRYQGSPMVGALDCVALRYAIECCGPSAFDALAITWFDQIRAFGRWPVCNRYLGAAGSLFFNGSDRIVPSYLDEPEQLERQRRLGERLRECRPEVENLPVPAADADPEGAARYCADVVGERLGIDVRLVSVGKTEDEKVFL